MPNKATDVMIRSGVWLALAATASLTACGGGDEPSAANGARVSTGGEAAASVETTGTDPLVLVANVHEAPLALLPEDWPDLFHFRFTDELLMPSPEDSPEIRAFMAGVIQAETLRAGTAEAGFDWLRRLDNVVLGYERESNDVRWRMRQGDAWFALLPASEVGPLLEREGFQVVELKSGMDPEAWGSAAGTPVRSVSGDAPGSGSESAPESGGDAAVEGVEVPGDWFTRWRTEVRGRG